MIPNEDKNAGPEAPLLEDFVRVLRSSMNVSSLYPSDHPSFKKSAEELRGKINEVLSAGVSLTIGVMPDRLVISGREFTGALSYGELASSLHQRKIKSVSFLPGITTEELTVFLSVITFSARDIAGHGGINSLLNRYSLQGIVVEDLDYQELLEGGTEEITQVWHFLLDEAMAKNDKQAVRHLVKHLVSEFKGVARRLGMQKFLDDEETSKSVNRFLDYLSQNDKEGFRECVNGLAETALNARAAGLDAGQVAKLKKFFRNCNDEDFAAILSGELIKKDDFDLLSLNVFSRLAEGRNHGNIAALTLDALRKEPLSSNQKVAKRIEKLFSGEAAPDIPGTYRTSLMLFLQNASFGKDQLLDREALEGNYFYMLLNLLMQERDAERAVKIGRQLESGWGKIVALGDTDYLHRLIEVSESRRTGPQPLPAEVLELLDRLVVSFVEELIWSSDFQDPSLLEKVKVSRKGADFYLQKFFEEGVVNPCALDLFIRLFPEKLDDFYVHLRLKSDDIDFLEQLVSALGETGHPLVQGMLETIYEFSNPLIRVRILKTMRHSPAPGVNFLLNVLKDENDVSLKRESLMIIMEQGIGEAEAAQALFGIQSPWGKKNKLLMANIAAAQEASFKAAIPSLESLSKRPFFWNSALRHKANEALRYLR